MANRREFVSGLLMACGVTFVNRSQTLTDLLASRFVHVEGGETDWELFEAAGQIVFPIYGVTGGLATRQMSWLIRERDAQWYAVPIEFTHAELRDPDIEAINRKITDATKQFGTPVNLDGGALPMPTRGDS